MKNCQIRRNVYHWITPGLVAIILFGVAMTSVEFTSRLCRDEGLSPGFNAYAQGQSEETRFLRENGFLTRWLALGPFIEGEQVPKAIEVDYLFLATGIPESKFATLEGAPKVGEGVSLTLEGYATQERIWKAMELPESGDVNKMLVEEGDIDYAVAYLLTFIEFKEASRRELLIGSDDAVKVWINGEVAHTAAVDRSLTPDEDRVFVNLKEGMNCLMLKVADSTVDWQLTARFKDESGLQFFDTSNRQLVPLGKRLIRLHNPKLEPPGTGTEGVWKTYRYVDGLASNYVNAIIQDKEGAIWFGTDNGVNRFDGVGWKTYTTKDGLAGNNVRAILQDKEGVIWFGTWGSGVSRFDGKSMPSNEVKGWKTYTQKDGLAGNWVNTILQDKEGVTWFGTYDGVSRFEGKSWKTYTQKDGLAGNNVRAILQDKEGAIWFGTNGGVSRFEGESWKTYTQKDGLAGNNVRAILQDKEGAIWFGTNGGVSRFEGESWKTYTTKDGLAGNWVDAIIQDKEGAIWFGTDNGVNRFEGESWRTYTQKDRLANNYVRAIIQDKEGAIWVGTYDGVSRFDGVGWKTYTTKDGLADGWVNAILQDKEEAIWFGIGGGVSRFDGESWRTYTQKDGLADNWARAIIQDKEGAIWFGTYVGVSRFDEKSWKTYTQNDGLANNDVWTILQDKEETIWFGTDNGVSRFDGVGWKTYTTKDGLASNYVQAIMQDKEGAIWFGTYVGVSRFDGKSWKIYTQKDGLASNYVNAIIQDKEGAIWFGTDNGVSRFDGVGWKTYTTKDGLASNDVQAIMQDKEGAIWVGTESGGISLFDGRCFQTIDSRDGLVNDNVRCLYEDRSGQIWIGTDSGVVLFIPNKVPPPVFITQMIADKTYENPKGTIKLSSGIHRISVSYHAISFKTRPGAMKYFVNLEKVPNLFKVSGPTNEETFEYFDLKPGKYTFRVQAVDRDLNYSEPASLDITISPPPFYQSPLFIILLVLGSFLIPTAVYASILTAQRRKVKVEFEPIPNPYMAGGPVRSEEMFFGREEDFKFVQNKLKTEKEGIVIVFYGQRRIGKTSLLHQILNGRLGDGFMPVLIDMQGMAVQNDGEFYEKIADEASFGLSEWLDVNATEYDFRTEGVNPARVFERFIDDIVEHAASAVPNIGTASLFQSSDEGETRGSLPVLLLMFDEYELLEEKMDNGIISRDTPTFLAGILEGNPRISLIFTGSRHLEARNPQYWSTLFGKSTARRISLLSERDTIRLTTEPVAESVKYQKAVPQRIYRLTGGQPFYTQHVCQLLIERLNEQKRQKVYADDVEQVALEFSNNPPPQIMYFWNEELDGKEKLALVLLGRMLERSDSYATASMVAEYVASREEGISLERTEIERIFDGLCQYELLERERVSEESYEYRYKIDLFRYWVQRHQSISKVMQELRET